MNPINLEEKFPDLRPIKSPPTLHTVNGIGLSVYGRRDWDEETGTYVTTHFFCLLFIPVLAIGAYRVANAPGGGWYFLGKVPLSSRARGWNLLLAAIALTAAVWFPVHAYFNSPDYLASRELAAADKLAVAGHVAEAAVTYRAIAEGKTSQSAPAVKNLAALLDGPADRAPAADAVAVFTALVALRDRPGVPPDLFDRGVARADKLTDDPGGALAILDAVAPLAKDQAALQGHQLPLLEKLVASRPDNVETVSRLAVIYDARGQTARCQPLLEPLRDKLGISEGARILGQIDARQGRDGPAYGLLQPYAEGRLKLLHAAEEAYTTAQKAQVKKVLDSVRSGHALDFPYETFNAADERRKNAIVLEYYEGQSKDDPDLNKAREAVLKEAPVVPVALDLGMVMLQRARGMADPAARKAELERAEKTFLAVRGQAGESNSYRLNLGRVYYWLGKHDEGRALFDEVLKTRNRETDTLLAVGTVLREVGAVSEARVLAEEAFGKESNTAKKNAAAQLRALMASEPRERITWLERAGADNSETQASLDLARGNLALQEGKDDEAARFLRKSAEGFAKLGGDSAPLNNGALAYFSLYRATGDRAAFARATDMLDQALALTPGDSILLSNAAYSLMQVASQDLAASGLDLAVLRPEAGFELLAFLYNDAASRDKLAERLRSHPATLKARAHLSRLLVLAPKNPNVYSLALALYAYGRDRDALCALARQAQGANLDTKETEQEALKYYRGDDGNKHGDRLKVQVARAEARLKAARQGKNPNTLAAAAATLAILKADNDSPPEMADAAVALAEEAHTAAPSEGTRSALMDALLFRAARDLAKAEPAYAALVTPPMRRAVGPRYLIAIALARPGKLRETALQNADVKRVASLILERSRRFPDEGGAWLQAMLQPFHPEIAERMGKKLLSDELERAEDTLESRINPTDATAALRVSWTNLLAGKGPEASQVLKACAARGVPLPVDLK